MVKMYQKSGFFRLCSKLALTMSMKFTVKVVLISIFQPAKPFVQKILVLDIFKIKIGLFSKCDDPMGQYEPRYVLHLADMSRYENET